MSYVFASFAGSNNFIIKQMACDEKDWDDTNEEVSDINIDSESDDAEMIKIVDDQGQFDDIIISKAELNEKMMSLFQLLARLNVLKYSTQRLKQTEEEHKTEIEARNSAISTIQPPKPLTKEDYHDPEIRRNNCWAKIIPTEILKLIFMHSIHNPDTYDKTVINLMLVSKDWRLTVLKFENDDEFQDLLWYPLLNKFTARSPMDWKDLLLIPDKYLKLLYNLHYRAMTNK